MKAVFHGSKLREWGAFASVPLLVFILTQYIIGSA